MIEFDDWLFDMFSIYGTRIISLFDLIIFCVIRYAIRLTVFSILKPIRVSIAKKSNDNNSCYVMNYILMITNELFNFYYRDR
jgi:hypothetical protein